MNVAVVGGGINGIMSAWALARAGHAVSLFERGKLMQATSRASTKLLHGGLRYLENGEFRLVREALRERQWWINFAPDLAAPQEILFPVFTHMQRPPWLVGSGIRLYTALAGAGSLGESRWLEVDEVLAKAPELKTDGLKGAWSFFDGAMQDYQLGMRAVEAAQRDGVRLYEDAVIQSVTTHGLLMLDGRPRQFDFIVNAAGPWVKVLLDASHIRSCHQLDYVQGSHLVVDISRRAGFLLEYPDDKRVFFVLPYQDKTLVGTTEIRLDGPDAPSVLDAEMEYLLNGYNHYFSPTLTPAQVVEAFSGIRPLIYSAKNPGKATREYAFEQQGRLISIFGGKWTTSRALGEALAKKIGQTERNHFGFC